MLEGERDVEGEREVEVEEVDIEVEVEGEVEGGISSSLLGSQGITNKSPAATFTKKPCRAVTPDRERKGERKRERNEK